MRLNKSNKHIQYIIITFKIDFYIFCKLCKYIFQNIALLFVICIYKFYFQVFIILFYFHFTINTKEKQSKTKQIIKQLQNNKIPHRFQRLLIINAIN